MAIPPKKLKNWADGSKPKGKLPPGKGKNGKKDDPPADEEEDETTDPGHEEPDGDEGDDGDTGDGDDTDKLVAKASKKVSADKADEQLKSLMGNYDPEEMDGQAPPWAKDTDLWTEAVAAVDPEGTGAEMPDVWLVVAEVYKAMGGQVGGADKPDDGDDAPEDGEDLPPDEADDYPEPA